MFFLNWNLPKWVVVSQYQWVTTWILHKYVTVIGVCIEIVFEYFWIVNFNISTQPSHQSAVSVPAVFPPNCGVDIHFREFLKFGNKSNEAIEVKFPYADSSRKLLSGTVGYVDGFTKVLIMVGVCCIIHHLEPWFELRKCFLRFKLWSDFYCHLILRPHNQLLSL